MRVWRARCPEVVKDLLQWQVYLLERFASAAAGVSGTGAGRAGSEGLSFGVRGGRGGLIDSARSAGAMTGLWRSGVKFRARKMLSVGRGMSFSNMEFGGVRGE